MSSVAHDGDSIAHKRMRPEQVFAFSLAGALLVLWAVLYRHTVWSMISIWARSDTFMHGFLILPLSAYLIYVRRDALRGVAIEPYVPGVAVLVILSVIWFTGWSATTDVVQEFAAVGMIAALVLVVLGRRFAALLAGPLAYLFFAVPFGEILIYPLREFTTQSIVVGLNLTGIGVVRSGFYLSTAAGDFSVEDACSGLRYLIASFALGTLFALLYLTTPRRRVIFMALSLIVPVIANGVRAYIIVVLAHISSMKIASGVDHLIYGWIFFGLVMLLLFWFGARMERRHAAPAVAPSHDTSTANAVPRKSMVIAAAAAAAALLLSPIARHAIEEREAGHATVKPQMPELAMWTLSGLADQTWVPAFSGHVGLATGSYRAAQPGTVRIDVAVAAYGETRDEGALIGFGNRTLDSKVWRERSRNLRSIALPSGERAAFLAVAVDSTTTQRRRVIWYTYLIDSTAVANDYWGKALQAWTRVVAPGRALWSLAFSAESADPDADLNSAVEAFARENFDRFAGQAKPSRASL